MGIFFGFGFSRPQRKFFVASRSNCTVLHGTGADIHVISASGCVVPDVPWETVLRLGMFLVDLTISYSLCCTVYPEKRSDQSHCGECLFSHFPSGDSQCRRFPLIQEIC